MKSKKETEELIERYCLGQMLPEELRIFEQWKDSDPELSSAIEEQRIITAAFRMYGERSEVKEKLNRIQDEMETEEYRFRAPLRVVSTQQSRARNLWQQYRIPAIAALISIVAVSASLLSVNFSNVGNQKSTHAYQELRREVENLKKNQKRIINNIKSDTKDTETASLKGFTGTGIALTQSGYILTSYHVVEDAKSVYVSNEKFEQLKASPIFTDPVLDLAVLKVEEENFQGFAEMPFSFRKAVADPGEKVFTLGYPRDEMVYGEGSVSSYTGFEGDTTSYQISIPVNPGNSGGPLFDGQGNLIGIISGRNATAEGASFAVKSRWIAETLKTHESTDNHWSIPLRKSLRGLDRTAQIKRLKEYVFMVKVYN